MAKIDVIIPIYNRQQQVTRAIASVIGQTFADWQLWLVDDGSSDGTPQVLANWQSREPRIRVIRQENRGVSAARNCAIAASSAPFLAFLDSDDEWLPTKLAEQLNFLEAHPAIPLLHCEEIWVRNGQRVNAKNKHKKSGGRIFSQCLPLCCISPSAAMLRRELLAEVGVFREDFVVCEDYELWLRICARYEVGFLPNPLVIKNGGHSDQLSRKYHSMDYFRIKAMVDWQGSSLLSSEEQQALGLELAMKSEVLLKGYRKHENLSHYDEIFAAQLAVG